MHVANFTPDTINWQHIGVEGAIKPDQVVELEDSRARHILNKYAARGLVQMNFGDEPEPKRKQSMSQWKNFWEEQVVTFNRHNEDQKEKGNRYATPTAEIKEHAEKLGLELLRPWRIESKDNPEFQKLKSENAELKGSLSTMQAQIDKLIEMVGKNQASQAETKVDKPKVSESADETVIEANRNKYKRLGESNMNLWVAKNWEDIKTMPEENRFEIEDKYLKIYGVPFPSEQI